MAFLRLGTAVGRVQIDLTELFKARGIAKTVIHDITTSTQSGSQYFTQFSATAVASLSVLTGAAISVAGRVERIRETFRLLVGDEEESTRQMALLTEMADKANQPFTDVLETAAQLIPTIKNTNVQLTTAVSVMERLAIIDPAQGIRGAGIALRDFLTGQYLPLAFRFELPRETLKTITEATKNNPEAAIEQLSKFLDVVGLTQDAVNELGQTTERVFAELGDETAQAIQAGFQPLLDTIFKPLGQILSDIFRTIRQEAPEVLTALTTGVTLTTLIAILNKIGPAGLIPTPIQAVRGAAEFASGLPGLASLSQIVYTKLTPLFGSLAASAIATVAPLAALIAGVVAFAIVLRKIEESRKAAQDEALEPLRKSIEEMATAAKEAASDLPKLTVGIRPIIEAQIRQVEQSERDIANTREQVVSDFNKNFHDLLMDFASSVPAYRQNFSPEQWQALNTLTPDQLDSFQHLMDIIQQGGEIDLTALADFDPNTLLTLSDAFLGSESNVSVGLRELIAASDQAATELTDASNQLRSEAASGPLKLLFADIGLGTPAMEELGSRLQDTLEGITENYARQHTAAGLLLNVLDAAGNKMDEWADQIKDWTEENQQAFSDMVDSYKQAAEALDQIRQMQSDRDFETNLQQPRTEMQDVRDTFDYILSRARDLAAFQTQRDLELITEYQREEDAVKNIADLRKQADDEIAENIEKNRLQERRALEDHLAAIANIIENLHYQLRDALISRNGAAALAALQNAKQSIDDENEKYDTGKKRRDEDFKSFMDDLRARGDAQVQAAADDLDRMKKNFQWQRAIDQAAFDERRQQEEADHVRRNYYRDIDRQLDEQADKDRFDRRVKAILDENALLQGAENKTQGYIKLLASIPVQLFDNIISAVRNSPGMQAILQYGGGDVPDILINPGVVADTTEKGKQGRQAADEAVKVLKDAEEARQAAFALSLIQSQQSQNELTQYMQNLTKYSSLMDYSTALVDEHAGKIKVQVDVEGKLLEQLSESTITSLGGIHKVVTDIIAAINVDTTSLFNTVGGAVNNTFTQMRTFAQNFLNSVAGFLGDLFSGAGGLFGGLFGGGGGSGGGGSSGGFGTAPVIPYAPDYVQDSLDDFWRDYYSGSTRSLGAMGLNGGSSGNTNIRIDFSGANIGKNVTQQDLDALQLTVVRGLLSGLQS